MPAAIEAATAKSRGAAGLSYVVGDVTRLPSANLGTFDFFLDIGCFQGLDAGQRLSEGSGVSALANPGATLLLLSFGPSRWRWLVEGASQEEVQTAFAGWEMLAAEPADTAGLGWPMNKTAPRWYRLRPGSWLLPPRSRPARSVSISRRHPGQLTLRLSPALPLDQSLAGVSVDRPAPSARPWPDGVIEYLTA